MSWVGELQWGRGFHAAEKRCSDHIVRMIWSLQWGRGFHAAENRQKRQLGVAVVLASMGPRLSRRGKAIARTAAEPGEWLQWGRGFHAAEK